MSRKPKKDPICIRATFMFNKESLEKISLLAKKTGKSKSSVVREGIEKLYDALVRENKI